MIRPNPVSSRPEMKPVVSIWTAKKAVFITEQGKDIDKCIIPLDGTGCQAFIQCENVRLFLIVPREMGHSGVDRKNALNINGGSGGFMANLPDDLQIIVGYDGIRNTLSDIINP